VRPESPVHDDHERHCDRRVRHGHGGRSGGGGDPVNCQTTPTDPACAPPPEICTTNPADPACAKPGPGPQPVNNAVGRPPEAGLFQAAPPDNKYTWTLGADLFFGGDVQQASYSASGACALSRRSTTITNGIATVVFVTVTAAGAAVAAASGDIITARFVFAATAEGYGVQV